MSPFRVILTYPDVKVEVLVRHRLDIEPYRRYCRDYFANLLRLSIQTPACITWLPLRLGVQLMLCLFQSATYLQPVKKGSLASIVLPFVISLHLCRTLSYRQPYKTQYEYPCLLLRPDQPREFRNIAAHDV